VRAERLEQAHDAPTITLPEDVVKRLEPFARLDYLKVSVGCGKILHDNNAFSLSPVHSTARSYRGVQKSMSCVQ
jgi:hypothetical protein